MNLEKIKEILAKNDSADYTRHQILKVIADDKQALISIFEMLTNDLKCIQVHAALTVEWTSALLKKLEGGKQKKEKKIKGLTVSERVELRAHMLKSRIKK